MIEFEWTIIFTQDDIFDPMQPILDTPMSANSISELPGRGG
jgi:hypothetical protein